MVIKDMYSRNAYFVCDRSKNIECPRVKRNEPCGNCKGTRNIKYADEKALMYPTIV